MGRKAGLNRSDVVDAAAAIADRDGFDALTLARLAGELGIKPPSLYNHVDGHDGLVLLLARRGADELTAVLRAVLEESDAQGRTHEATVRAMCRAFRDFAHRHHGLYAAFNAGTALASTDDDLEAIRRPLPVVLEVLLPFGLSEEQTIHAMRVFRGTLHGFITLEQGFNLPVDPDDSYELAIDLFIEGVRAIGRRNERVSRSGARR